MSMSHGFDAFGIDKPRIGCLRQRGSGHRLHGLTRIDCLRQGKVATNYTNHTNGSRITRIEILRDLRAKPPCTPCPVRTRLGHGFDVFGI